MRSFSLILILFFLGTKFPRINCQENGFYNFLYNAAEAFPSWIAQNGFDPTPVIPDQLSLEYSQGLVNITAGKIWNQVMSGHSERVSYPSPEISANLLLGNIYVRIPLSDFIVTSDYEVEGTVLSSIPITGAGKVTSNLGYYKSVELNVNGFELTPDGYIDISAGSVDTWFYFEFDTTSFEGLSAGGYETEVERILKDVYESKLRQDYFSMFPLADYLREYMEELFAKTPISEIIDTTRAPPTEDPPSTTTEVTRTTSTSEVPCRSSVFGADGSTLLEEKVLQTILTLNENGEKVEIVEKLVKFERKV